MPRAKRRSRRFGHKNVSYIGNIDNAADIVCGELQQGDLVITLGAGSVTRLSDEVLEKLGSGSREAQPA